jgi:hypothetical protein
VVRLSRNPIPSINHTISAYPQLHTPPYIKQHPQPLSIIYLLTTFTHQISPILPNMDYSTLPTPPNCVADFSLSPVRPLSRFPFPFPFDFSPRTYYHPPSPPFDTSIQLNARLQIGTPTASISNEIAAVQQLMKASGLSYSMHSAGTTVGSFSLSSLDSSYPQCQKVTCFPAQPCKIAISISLLSLLILMVNRRTVGVRNIPNRPGTHPRAPQRGNAYPDRRTDRDAHRQGGAFR